MPSFSQLETMSMKDFVAAHAARRGLWFLVHIPKTAGSSLSSEFGRLVRPYANIFVDYNDMSLSHEARLLDVVDQFVADLRYTDYRSASGHVPFDIAQRIRVARPDMRMLTFLRDPIDRLISDFRYQRTSAHPGNEAFRARFPTIQDYMRSPASQNKIAHFLVGNTRKTSAAQVVDQLGRRFAFVGLFEKYEMTFGNAFAAMGHPNRHPTSHERKTPDTAETRVTVTAELREEIESLNALDMAAYSYAAGVLARHEAKS